MGVCGNISRVMNAVRGGCGSTERATVNYSFLKLLQVHSSKRTTVAYIEKIRFRTNSAV